MKLHCVRLWDGWFWTNSKHHSVDSSEMRTKNWEMTSFIFWVKLWGQRGLFCTGMTVGRVYCWAQQTLPVSASSKYTLVALYHHHHLPILTARQSNWTLSKECFLQEISQRGLPGNIQSSTSFGALNRAGAIALADYEFVGTTRYWS